MYQRNERQSEVTIYFVDLTVVLYKTLINTFLPLSDPHHKKRHSLSQKSEVRGN